MGRPRRYECKKSRSSSAEQRVRVRNDKKVATHLRPFVTFTVQPQLSFLSWIIRVPSSLFRPSPQIGINSHLSMSHY